MDNVAAVQMIQEYLKGFDGKPTPYLKNTNSKLNFFKNSAQIGKGTPQAIKKNLKLNLKAGIDCSGLICNIINKIKPIKSVIFNPSSNPVSQIRFFLRPIQNIDVKTLIHSVNSYTVSIPEVKRWDLINLGYEHIMLVYKINNDTLYYIHASETKKLVEEESIKITNVGKSLDKQKWSDKSYLKKFLTTKNSGIRRFKRLSI